MCAEGEMALRRISAGGKPISRTPGAAAPKGGASVSGAHAGDARTGSEPAGQALSGADVAAADRTASALRDAAAAVAPAFADFVAAHTAVAYRVAYLVLRDAFAAEEVAQDAFLRAWRQARWRRLDRPAAWLARVAWRLALDRRRAQARAARTGPWIADAPSAAPGAERHFAAQEQLARLQVLIAALPPALRHPLQLAGLREFENAEIAAILGISPAAVRRRLMRARQTLRAKLLREEMVNEKPAHEPRSNR